MTPPRGGALVLFAVVAALLLLLAPAAHADDGACDCGATAAGDGASGGDHACAKTLKVAAFFSILVCGALGCLLPVLGRRVPALRADGDVFFLVKAFAAGLPFAGLGTMVGAIGTLVVDTVATGYFTRLHFKDTVGGGGVGVSAAAVGDEEKQQREAAAHGGGGGGEDHEGHLHMHTHATHGHAHGSTALVAAVGGGGGDGEKEHALRHRVIAQVLELGIVVHSVIIGISLGASEETSTIKPLVVALSFHQMFEGMGLGGCIVQAKFKVRSIVTMVLFFCLTTPVGILVGIGISSVYNENSPTALIVEGILNSVAAGILVYMALVDLLAEDFMNPKVQSRGKLQLGINVSMLIGAGLMSMLAKWA
nr:unnamed protein product [Digitaria exilis]